MRTVKYRTLNYLPLFLTAFLCASAENIYHIGNSHTWDIQPSSGFRNMGESQGIQISNGWQIYCGHSLRAIVDEPDSNCVDPSEYGLWQQALRDYTWDAIILQPYPGHSAKEEEQAVKTLVQYSLDNSGANPPVYYIYASWPTNTDSNLVGFDYTTAWLEEFGSKNEGWSASREFYEYLSEEIKSENLDTEVNMILAGEVINEFHIASQSGDIPGFNGAGELYRDAYHMNNIGKYLVSLTIYSQVFSAEPQSIGLIDDFYHEKLDEDLAGIIAELINKVFQSREVVLWNLTRNANKKPISGWARHLTDTRFDRQWRIIYKMVQGITEP
jgi:hypothetical protein